MAGQTDRSYPIIGAPLAPVPLQPLLERSITAVRGGERVTIRLRDLDGSAWARFSDETCRYLARRILREVRKRIRKGLPNEIVDRHLPRPAPGTSLSELIVEPHALRALQKLGYSQDPSQLGDLTIGQFVAIKGIGAKALVDFLVLTEIKHSVSPLDESNQRSSTHRRNGKNAVHAQRHIAANNRSYRLGAGYPRLNHPIAPSVLSPILQKRVYVSSDDSRTEMLAELDATAWNRLTPDECKRLGTMVVEEVGAALQKRLPVAIASTPIPTRTELRLVELELEPRTYHAVRRLVQPEFVEDLSRSKLANMSIEGFATLRNIGPKTLVDLLTSLEHAGAVPRARVESANDDLVATTMSHESDSSETVSLDAQLTNIAKEMRGHEDASKIWTRDFRFGPDLRGIAGLMGLDARSHNTLRGLCEAICDRRSDPPFLNGLRNALRNFSEKISNATQLTLEEELQSVLEATEPRRAGSLHSEKSISVDQRAIKIASRRLGWDGRAPATLREVGDEFGLTRERVRQITNKKLDRLKPFAKTWAPSYAPALDACRELVLAHVPISSEQMQVVMYEAHVTETDFDPESLLQAMQLLGRDAGVHLADFAGRLFLVREDDNELFREIDQIVRKSIQAWGAMTVDDLIVQLEESSGRMINREPLKAVLDTNSQLHWLDEQGSWFWSSGVPSNRNRLRNNMAKVLSVAQGIDAADLRRALARHHRTEGIAPPKQVILELCHQLPEYRVTGNRVVADPPLDWLEVLAETEETIVSVLKEHGPIMARADFEEACIDLGMARSTFYVYLGYSPVISRYARGVYGLVGSKASPGDIESLMIPSPRGKVLSDYGWTEEGKVWITYTLSESSVKSGVLGLPSGLSSIVQGEFTATTTKKIRVGTLNTRGSSLWGLGPYFRRRGGDAGDALALVFDLSAREVQLELGDEELLDEFSH